jgi:hypothetical protein
VKGYYEVIIDVQKMKVSLIPADTFLIKAMDNVVESQRQAEILLKGYTASYNVLSGYADLLLELTNDTSIKILKKSNEAFIAKFDTAMVKYNSYTGGTNLPVSSIGGVVSKIILEAGTKRIKYLQRKYLVELINKGDSIVGLICDNYSIIDHRRDSTAILIDRVDLKNTFTIFINELQNHPGAANSFNRYKEYHQTYYNWVAKLDALALLDHHNTVAFKKLKVSQMQLREALNKRMTFKTFVDSVKDLYGSINAINNTLKTLQKDLKSNQ